jgi:hypothetical protein
MFLAQDWSCTPAVARMTAEITYIAVYLLGLSVGAIFVIIAKGISYEDLWLQKNEDTYQDDREISSK